MNLLAGEPIEHRDSSRLRVIPERFVSTTVDRKIWPILLISVVLHALALAWVRGLPEAPPALPKIIAQLRLVVAPEVAKSSEPVAAVAPSPAPTPAFPKARQLPPRQDSRSRPAGAEAAAPLTDAPVRVAEPPRTPVLPVANLAELPQKSVEAPVPAARPQGPLLDAYRQRLSDLLASQQQYPRVAAMRGWEGQVRLRLRVARKGNLIAVQLDQSSGFEVLDQHALGMLERIAGLPPLPEGLESQEIQVVVPINYKLKNAT